MWAITAAVGLAALGLVGGRALRRRFDWLEPRVLSAFTRFWHHGTSNGPAPLPPTGPALVVANHPSPADPAFLIATCGRPLGFLHAREYCDVFLLRGLFRLAGSIPLARDGHDVRAVRAALRRLRAGAVLGIFPEGEVTSVARARGLPLKAGAALVALRSRAPVIPAYIAGSRGGPNVVRAWLLPSRHVRVTYGPPVDLRAYYGRPITRALLREVTALLMRRVTDLRPAPSAAKPAAARYLHCPTS